MLLNVYFFEDDQNLFIFIQNHFHTVDDNTTIRLHVLTLVNALTKEN